MSSIIARRKRSLITLSVIAVGSLIFFSSLSDSAAKLAINDYIPPFTADLKTQQKELQQHEQHDNKEVVTEKIYVTVDQGSGPTVTQTVLATHTVYVESPSSAAQQAAPNSHRDQSPFLGHDIKPKEHHLLPEQFDTVGQFTFPSGRDAGRLVSNEVWRDPSSYPDDYYLTDNLRPQIPDLSYYENKAQYMRQVIPKDYAENASKMFVMMKTGATVLWNRVPIHLLTTFTRVPYFALYADHPASIAGHEVIDILANTTEATKQTGAYRHYRTLQDLFYSRANADPAEGVDGHDGWSLDRHKNVPMLAHGYRTAPKDVEWFFFMDGDTYMFMDNLMGYLDTLNSSEPIYLGCSHWLYGKRFAHGGSGVVLSRAALDITLGEHPEWEWEMEEETSRVCCGDYMVSQMMERVNVSVSHGDMHGIGRQFNDEHHWSLYSAPENWCERILGFHHVRPFEVELLWEYEKTLGPERRKHITYADIYRDFTAPFIKEYMEDWDSMAMETQFCKKWDEEEAERERQREEEEGQKGTNEKRKSDEPRPWHSAKLCKEACDEDSECLSWRYLPNSEYCGLGIAVRLGRPATYKFLKYDEQEVLWDHEHATSGYMIERIRAMRSQQTCDVIYGTTPENDKMELAAISRGEVVDRFEGWGLRLQDKVRSNGVKKKLLDGLAKLKGNSARSEGEPEE